MLGKNSLRVGLKNVIAHHSVYRAMNAFSTQPINKILVIRGQGIGPECVEAAKKVLDSTGVPITYIEGSLGYPDAKDLFPLLQKRCPDAFRAQFGSEDPVSAAARLEAEAKQEARAKGNINDFYKKILAKLNTELVNNIKPLIFDLERETLKEAQKVSAVLKGALRTLDEGYEPSRNVTIRKALEQYANIRRCVALTPIVPGTKGTDILFVRENVEDLYASIEHRLGRNYPQALRHQTPEGCELICRAAFEAAIRDGRKKVTALEKPNILKITGGLFKDAFNRVAQDYSKARLGDKAIEANFMIIDDGLAAIAATPEKFDVVVTSNMFGDIGSDIAAKVAGGVGLVSSNNTNPNNPRAVSMFETMGGTADDIAGQNKANPVALIDAAAEMLMHIGGKENLLAAELIKTATLQVLADGYYVGDIKKGEYQEKKGKEKLGTQEFADKIIEKIQILREKKNQFSDKSVKQIALDMIASQADNAEIKPLFDKVLVSYENYAKEMIPGNDQWFSFVQRNLPPNPPKSISKIIGFDLFIDNPGMHIAYTENGELDEIGTKVDPNVSALFYQETNFRLQDIFAEGKFSSIQSIRSFGQFATRILTDYKNHLVTTSPSTDLSSLRLDGFDWDKTFGRSFFEKFSFYFLQCPLPEAIQKLTSFNDKSIHLIQAFYKIRAAEIAPIVKKHGFKLIRVTSRGTEIYPTMVDFEKRDVDRYRIEIDPNGKYASGKTYSHREIQLSMFSAKWEIAQKGWIVSETMLNRDFTDLEGSNQGKVVSGVSVPYARGLGTNYADATSDKK
jgi:isocitrate/isopropylmalate dehydrogenase